MLMRRNGVVGSTMVKLGFLLYYAREKRQECICEMEQRGGG